MTAKTKITIALVVLAIASAFLLNWLGGDKTLRFTRKDHRPDYYMENFNTLTMDQDGKPKNRLTAEYMAHYPDDDTTELIKPILELYRIDKPPMLIEAEKGWVTSNNEVILLTGEVILIQNDINNELELRVDTSDVRILMDQDYAETDKHALITGKRTVVNTTGMRAYFKQNRIELLNNVTGKIEPKKTL